MKKGWYHIIQRVLTTVVSVNIFKYLKTYIVYPTGEIPHCDHP